MDVQDFVARWNQSKLREQQAAQSHFNELCQLINHPTPTQADPDGTFFTFEEHVEKATGGKGRADVWYKDHFAWEYKGKLRDLDAAYQQLLSYRGDLDNPPLLVVCDFTEYRIYPQFPNTSGKPFVFKNEDLADPKYLNWIRWLFTEPDRFLAQRQAELEQRERLTQDLAKAFAKLADLLRKHPSESNPAWTPIQIARYLTRLLFILFAEDIQLLPVIERKTAFEYILDNAVDSPHEYVPAIQALFEAMDGRTKSFMMKRVPYFNGGLFARSTDEGDQSEVLDVTQVPGALAVLRSATQAVWKDVNPTIFGTMFEGALDPSKRAQLGAHYTSEADIRLVLEPVLMLPLNREWDAIRAEAEPLMQTYLTNDSPRAQNDAREKLIPLYERMMSRLESVTLLDPACGSGNFLYMSLRLMKDLEGRVRMFFAPLTLPARDVVTPRQLYGIEKDEFAAKLAQVVVWIGYLQWRYEHEGEKLDNLPSPILRDKYRPDEPDHILCADAILRYDEHGKPYEPDWQPVDVIVGNPPFLGAKRLIGELGEQYVDDLRSIYDERLPGFSDLVTYWFEHARLQLEKRQVKRVGLLATNSIAMGTNLPVLKRIKESGDVFLAWSDRDWILDGAAVRVSIVGFDDGSENQKTLDGSAVTTINADLTTTLDLTSARVLAENARIGFVGTQKSGAFDLPESKAREMLESANVSGYNNADVIFPYRNSLDLTQRVRNVWVIDFGTSMSEDEAAKYELPFRHVEQFVRPMRADVRRKAHRDRWWIHGDARPGMRQSLKNLDRFVVTPTVSKHRLFVWFQRGVHPDHQLIVFARDDDYFFGTLHSYPHQIWSLRQGTSLEDRPRYTPTTTFETFPLPYPPGREDIGSPAYQAISEAAKALHEERDAWLNPAELIALGADAKLLKDRTLTNLYNAVEAYRAGKGGSSRENPAIMFAPRLAQLHEALDRAVLGAYGWSDLADHLRTPEGDEELLRRLLALNLERANQTK
jgi:hypothetical protein